MFAVLQLVVVVTVRGWMVVGSRSKETLGRRGVGCASLVDEVPTAPDAGGGAEVDDI